jgi:tRNA pseudouridine38-40 synthase
MGRYRFAVEYLGTAYAGWQIQPGQPTVQETLEKAFRTCLRADITVMGSGRTDAGVHARAQVAHFDCDSAFDPRRVEHSVNALTPGDVFVRRLEACRNDFHARYDATSRTYHYRIARRPTALMGHVSWYPGFTVDPDRLRDELRTLEGTRDFVNFSVPRDDGKSTDCTLLRTDVIAETDVLVVIVEANRFLHKMVRSMVGAAFDVARGAKAPGLLRSILDGSFGGPGEERTWAPAQGLCLEKVAYPDYEV